MNGLEITPAEWQVMRIVWSKQAVTSTEVIRLLAPSTGWKEATIKTLLRRLVAKGALATERDGRAFIYRPLVAEQATIDQALTGLLAEICQRHVGAALLHAIETVPLSQTDIANLQASLERKVTTAPAKLPCNCLPMACHC